MHTNGAPSRNAAVAFLGVVAAAAVVLVVETRNMWFGGDEWFVLTDRGVTAGAGHQGALEPFNEHWTTLPILAFRALYSTVGLHSYRPYLALVLVSHLGVVVLLWAIMIRARIDEWVAVAACAVFAVLGIGFENLINAWQVTLVASLAFGLGALVVAPQTGRFGARDVAAAALLVASMASSGVGIPLLAVVALVSWVRRGWRIAAATVAVPAAVYGAWYLAYGRDAEQIADPAPAEVPSFVARGIADAVGDVARVGVLGVAVVVATAIWLAVTVVRRGFDRNLLVPCALALGGIAFLASTGWRRANLPGADPAASRYAYLTIAFFLPLVATASQPLFRGDTARRVALVVVTGALVVAQVRVLDHEVELAEPGKRSDRGAMLATAALARGGRQFVYRSPLHPFEPQVTVDEIVQMHRDGKLPSLDGATRRDFLTVLARLELALRPDAVVEPAPGTTVALGPARGVRFVPSAVPGCLDVAVAARTGDDPDGDPNDHDNEVVLRPSGPAVVRIRGDGPVRIWLRDEARDIDGEAVVGVLERGTEQLLSMAGIDGSVVLALPPGPGVVLCGVE